MRLAALLVAFAVFQDREVPKYKNWLYDYPAGLKAARESDKPLMIVFR